MALVSREEPPPPPPPPLAHGASCTLAIEEASHTKIRLYTEFTLLHCPTIFIKCPLRSELHLIHSYSWWPFSATQETTDDRTTGRVHNPRQHKSFLSFSLSFFFTILCAFSPLLRHCTPFHRTPTTRIAQWAEWEDEPVNGNSRCQRQLVFTNEWVGSRVNLSAA